LSASHRENKFRLGNELIHLQKGEFITSELKLMERWKWSKSKVRNFLRLLVEDGMIVKKADTKKTAITIVNWGLYQVSKTAKEPRKNHAETAKEPRKDTINNVNNGNNEDKGNKEPLSPASEGDVPEARRVSVFEQRFNEFWGVYPKKTAKKTALAAYIKAKPSAELHIKILEAVEAARCSDKWQRDNGRYIPNPATWLNGGCWDDEVMRTSDGKASGRDSAGLNKNYDEDF
jgi:hypothetical protein